MMSTRGAVQGDGDAVNLEIPVCDLRDLHHHRLERRASAAQAIFDGFRDFGLVYVRGHDILADGLEDFYRDFVSFTDRPMEEKEALARPEIWFQRGWTPPNTERAVVAGGQPDFKECFFVAVEPGNPTCAAQYPELYAENIWPEDAPDFKSRYIALGHRLHEVGLDLLRGAAMALDLLPTEFVAMVHGGPHVTRALRYLPLTKAQTQDDILWGEEHTDFNLITLLPGGRFFDAQSQLCPRPDEGSGLYLRTRPTAKFPAGRRVKGTPPPGCIVAQVGQQLEILTGGTFQATPHVVTAPKTAGFSRTSMAHFVHLSTKQILFPMKPFRTPEVVRAFSPPVLVGTYNTKTLVDIGLAPTRSLHAFGYRNYDRLDKQRDLEEG